MSLKEAYELHFATRQIDAQWTDLCGQYKAQNVLRVASSHLDSTTTVLEFGAGEGSVLKYLSPHVGQLFAVEVASNVVDFVKRRCIPNLVQIQSFDGQKIPYADKRFDVCVCLHVLEHVEHPRLVLRELSRVSHLQVLEVPLDYSIGIDEHIEEFTSYGHINVFTPSTFKFLLRSEGFEIVSEHLSRASKDVLRYDWFINKQLPKTLTRQLKVSLRDQIFLMKRLLMRKEKYDEFTYSAFTVLVRPRGALRIF